MSKSTPYYYQFTYDFAGETRWLYVRYGKKPSAQLLRIVIRSLAASYEMCDSKLVYMLESGFLCYIAWKDLRPMLLRKDREITYYPELPFLTEDDYVVPY